MSQGGNLNPLVPMTGGGPVMGVVFFTRLSINGCSYWSRDGYVSSSLFVY